MHPLSLFSLPFYQAAEEARSMRGSFVGAAEALRCHKCRLGDDSRGGVSAFAVQRTAGTAPIRSRAPFESCLEIDSLAREIDSLRAKFVK